MGDAWTSPMQTIFRQLSDGQFSPNLATTRESMSPRNLSDGIFENIPFRSHLSSQKTSTLRTLLRNKYDDDKGLNYKDTVHSAL